MCKCVNCLYFEFLNEFDELDREAANDGYIGFCNLDGLYIPPDYDCNSFFVGVIKCPVTIL